VERRREYRYILYLRSLNVFPQENGAIFYIILIIEEFISEPS